MFTDSGSQQEDIYIISLQMYFTDDRSQSNIQPQANFTAYNLKLAQE